MKNGASQSAVNRLQRGAARLEPAGNSAAPKEHRRALIFLRFAKYKVHIKISVPIFIFDSLSLTSAVQL